MRQGAQQTASCNRSKALWSRIGEEIQDARRLGEPSARCHPTSVGGVMSDE